MVVIGETYTQGGQPNLTFCKSYAQQHGVPLNKAYIDYGYPYGAWNTVFSNINNYVNPGGSFNLPWDCILDAEGMTYIYSSTNSNSFPDINAALNAALQ